VRRRRLLRCRAELDGADTEASITEIAYRWGFNDSAHFSRLFSLFRNVADTISAFAGTGRIRQVIAFPAVFSGQTDEAVTGGASLFAMGSCGYQVDSVGGRRRK
jgi:hypothetical protein